MNKHLPKMFSCGSVKQMSLVCQSPGKKMELKLNVFLLTL